MQLFLLATTRISHSNHPMLHKVIPIIDKLCEALKTASKNDQVHPIIAQLCGVVA